MPRSAAEVADERDRQRVDRWLWHARLVRTRAAAAALAEAGFVRINGMRIDAPGRMVRAGDMITVALDRRVRVLKVTGFALRRGPAGNAATLYEDLDEAGSGRSALHAPNPMG
ncbi:MAG TPA: S4 domain-containing protein [Xanthobacteraceae bacterium]|jgi:ribosome-associated heat shock protein Hsp15|nr:S4 domain-containing protein [Xanthobacteraceae bacterium]